MSRGVGIHGDGMQRDVGVVLEGGTPAWVNANNDAVCALMIEKKQAVDDLEQLLSVPGVDMVPASCLMCGGCMHHTNLSF
jgi:2-keto-3-deoxy-L-rhamnonate aldolase RhmA